MKIGAKARKKQKQSIFCPFVAAVFSTPETGGDQAILVGGNNNTGVWGQSPQLPEANGGSGAEPPTLRRFYSFLYKKYAFFVIFWSIFLLKMRF